MIRLTHRVRRIGPPASPGGFVVIERDRAVWLLTETEFGIFADGEAVEERLTERLARDWSTSRVLDVAHVPRMVDVHDTERVWVLDAAAGRECQGARS